MFGPTRCSLLRDFQTVRVFSYTFLSSDVRSRLPIIVRAAAWPKPYPGHRISEAVPDIRQLSEDFAIPTAGECTHGFLDQRVGTVERQMHGGWSAPQGRCSRGAPPVAPMPRQASQSSLPRRCRRTRKDRASPRRRRPLRNSPKARRVASVSLAQIGTLVRARRLARRSAFAILIGSSAQNGRNSARPGTPAQLPAKSRANEAPP